MVKRDRNHYIPCFLSKGFADPVDRKKGRFRLFREGQSDVPSSPEAWGAEVGFYEDGEGRDIDPGWRNTEPEDAETVRKLRKGEVDDETWRKVPGLLTRLQERTKSMREHMERLLIDIMEEIVGVSGRQKGEDIQRDFVERMEAKDEGLAEIVANSIRRRGTIRKITRKRVSREMESLAWRARRMPQSLIAKLPERMVHTTKTTAMPSARDEQIKRLDTNIQTGQVWAEYARNGIIFEICDVEPEVMCLGDSVVVVERQGGECWLPMVGIHHPMRAVYLPVSSGRLLVGRMPGVKIRETSWVLNAIAALSTRSFVSRVRTADAVWMHGRIGSLCQRTPDGEVQKVLEGSRWR